MKRKVLLLIAISLIVVLGAVGVLLHLGYLLPTWITWERKAIICTEVSAPDTIILRNRTVSVLQDETEVWQSEKRVKVQDVLWEDIDHDDEPEMVIRVLSFGPTVEVLESESFKKLIIAKLKSQKSCELI